MKIANWFWSMICIFALFGVSVTCQISLSIMARVLEGRFHKTLAYKKWKKVYEYCSFEPAIIGLYAGEEDWVEYFPQIIFGNNPEGVLEKDTADVGKSLFSLGLTSGHYRFYGTHVNFTNQVGTY